MDCEDEGKIWTLKSENKTRIEKNVEIGEEKQGNIDIKINNREQKGSAMDRSTLCIYSF